MRHTANDGCFHRHVEMRRNSEGLLVKKLIVLRNMLIGYDETDDMIDDDVDHIDVEIQRIVNEDKFHRCAAYEIEWI